MTAQNYLSDDYLIDDDSGTVIVSADIQEMESISYGVLTAMARATERTFEEIDPLCTTLDTDALEMLFAGTPSKDESALLTLRFVHDGCKVLVTENRRISVQPLE